MHDPRAGLSRTEEVYRMVGRVAEKQRDRRSLAVARAEKRRSGSVDAHREIRKRHLLVAEVDDRPVAVGLYGAFDQAGQRAGGNLRIPPDAVRIVLLPEPR